jgi:hypothetical protein
MASRQEKTAGVAGGLVWVASCRQVRTFVQPPVAGENQKYAKRYDA